MNRSQERLRAEINRTNDPLLCQQLEEEYEAWAMYGSDVPQYLSPIFKLQEIRIRYAVRRGEIYKFYKYVPGIPDENNQLPYEHTNYQDRTSQ